MTTSVPSEAWELRGGKDICARREGFDPSYDVEDIFGRVRGLLFEPWIQFPEVRFEHAPHGGGGLVEFKHGVRVGAVQIVGFDRVADRPAARRCLLRPTSAPSVDGGAEVGIDLRSFSR